MLSMLQSTLDLFGADPAAVPVPVKPKKKRAVAQTPSAPLAIDSIANSLLVPLAAPLAEYRHPAANRELQLPGALVAFAFKRAKRRSIGFVVGAQGLVVSAPRWVPLAGVDDAVRGKGGWIVQKLGEAQVRQAQQQATRIVWRDGASFPYLGQPVQLALVPGQRGALLQDGVLQLGLPLDATPEKIRAATHKWLLAQARALFAQRLNHFAPQLGVQWTRLALSSAATRWGSANVTGAIRLNWRLLHHSLEIIDYVVVHELSHLRYMDHSARFWDTVGSILPGYPALRAELRTVAIPKWDE
ncbi:M48 family metallopeptidase [Rhodoferax sp.]|uniref:M48 family metallopeptidase n=1 Tax=Rhodoferax sp. TaxID=50421 RepID=UPI00374D493F